MTETIQSHLPKRDGLVTTKNAHPGRNACVDGLILRGEEEFSRVSEQPADVVRFLS